MSEKDIKINKKRVGFSKRIKRKILLEVAKGKKMEDALLEHAFVSLEGITTDKKYAAKLFYKWSKEVYEHRDMLFLLNHEVDSDMIDDEIDNIGEDEEDEIDLAIAAEEIKNEFLRLLQ